MAVFPHPGWWLGVPTQQSRKISIPLINNPPGNYCLVRITGNLFPANLAQ
jgi:hypothetical protein